MRNNLVVFSLATVALAAVMARPDPAPAEAKLFGGQDAAPGEFPWMVSLRIKDQHTCGGSIVNAHTILTAAHCVSWITPQLLPTLTVWSGTNSLSSGGHHSAVKKITVHPNYERTNLFVNDIALLQLETGIVCSDTVFPTTLPAQDEPLQDDGHFTLSGWCLSHYPIAQPPNNLQKIDMDVISNTDCMTTLAKHKSPLHLHPDHMCAGMEIVGKDICQGDPGSPLVSEGKQVGIASLVCGYWDGSPGLYTRVATFSDWIAENSFQA